jgi:hypothetical protein
MRLASARSAREGPARHGEVAGRLPGRCVTRCRGCCSRGLTYTGARISPW